MIKSGQINRFGVVFSVIIGEVSPNLRDQNSLCVKWYATCEGQTSSPKGIVIPYNSLKLVDLQPSIESIKNADVYTAIADMILSTMYVKCSGEALNVLELTLLERDTADPECRVVWNIQHKSFNPQSWAKAT